MRRVLKLITSKLLFIVPLVLLQFGLFALAFFRATLFLEIQPVVTAVAWMFTIYIVNRHEEPSFKIAWIVTILGMPIVGISLYLIFGNRKMPKRLVEDTTQASREMEKLLDPSETLLEELKGGNEDLKEVFRYGIKRCGFPVWRNTECRYFASGEEWKPVYLEELRKAKFFIFIEFFIISEGNLLSEVSQILKDKVKEGVQVVLIYDDFGCVTVPRVYLRDLQEAGIEVYSFNRIRPALAAQMNNRDHRKLTIIDNRTGFTGGVNLADEYVNEIARFGYWKDSAVMLKGEAVWSMTVMFMGMYSYVLGNDIKVNFLAYKLSCSDIAGDGGLYQPWSDTPTDNEYVALNMHLNMISHAGRYIYIDTPYLILNEAMTSSLRLAAKNGVDVRILVPKIPDKFFTNQITKSYYLTLLEAGVRIYEYTPGFVHAKNFVSDDRIAIVGTANTDFRSYYLHFEDGILMHGTPEILRIREDFEASLKQAEEITEEAARNVNIILRLLRAMLALMRQMF